MTKNEIKYYSSLLNKKYRAAERKFLVEGKRIILDALAGSYKCEAVFASHDFYSAERDFFAETENRNIRTEVLQKRDFLRLCDTENPQGIAGVFHMQEYPEESFGSAGLICALEDISDPGNLGTIIRNCDWFGVTEIVVSSGSADIYNPKCIRSTMGSIFHVSVLQTDNFISILKSLKGKGYSILNSDMNGESLFTIQSNLKSVIALSNEAFGPSQQLSSIADRTITIPRLGKAESLNVANASAVILAQLTK